VTHELRDADELVRELLAAHLHPDPAVRAARLAAIEQREAAVLALYERLEQGLTLQ
jgi:hypothetical protein